MKIILSLLLITLVFTSNAQTGTIRGIVMDNTSESTLNFVKAGAQLVGEDDFVFAETKFEGIYSFSSLKPGTYLLTLYSMKYEKLEITGVIVRKDQMTFQRATLKLLTYESEELKTVSKE